MIQLLLIPFILISSNHSKAEESPQVEKCEEYSELKLKIEKAVSSDFVAQNCRDALIQSADQCKATMSTNQDQMPKVKTQDGDLVDLVQTQQSVYITAQSLLIATRDTCKQLKNSMIQTCQQAQYSLDEAIKNNNIDRNKKLSELYSAPQNAENIAAKTEIQNDYAQINYQLNSQKTATSSARGVGEYVHTKLSDCVNSHIKIYQAAIAEVSSTLAGLRPKNPDVYPPDDSIDDASAPQPHGENAELKAVKDKTIETSLSKTAEYQSEKYKILSEAKEEKAKVTAKQYQGLIDSAENKTVAAQTYKGLADTAREGSEVARDLNAVSTTAKVAGKAIGPLVVGNSLIEGDPINAMVGSAQTLTEWLAPTRFATMATGYGWFFSVLLSPNKTTKCDTIDYDPISSAYKGCPVTSIQGKDRNLQAMGYVDQ